MPTNNDLTPEQIAEVQAKLLQSCNGHPNAEISWPHYILHQAHAAIEQLQRQLTDAEKREHKLMIDFGMKCNELAEASLLSSGLNDAVQGRTQSLAEIERSLRPQPTVLSQATLRIHDSPESAFSALYDVNFAEIDSIGGVDEKGEETECNPKDAMDGMRQMGLWGCCHTDSATVHVWASPEASDSYLLMLLGHELGHIIKDGPFEVSLSPEHVPDEQDADRYGWAAKEAYRMLRILRPSPAPTSKKSLSQVCQDLIDASKGSPVPIVPVKFDAPAPTKKRGGRTFENNGTVYCDECCNGDRCDDRTHRQRKGCPYCLGTGVIEPPI